MTRAHFRHGLIGIASAPMTKEGPCASQRRPQPSRSTPRAARALLDTACRSPPRPPKRARTGRLDRLHRASARRLRIQADASYASSVAKNPLRVGEVFVPGKLPELTYNPREDLHLEQALEDFVDESGAILTVAGPTKTGKSVLLRRTIANPLWCDGQGIDSVDTLWRLVADQLGVYLTLETSAEKSTTGSAEVGVDVGLKVGGEYSASDSTGRRFSVDRPLVSAVRDGIVASRRPLVVDDFHFVERPVQREIVRALKPLVLLGVPVIFASISHRVQDVVSAEPDMTGRVVPLEIPFWSVPELIVIARSGFAALNVVDRDDRLATILASEAYGSPHLMQRFCRELCKANGVREAQEIRRALQQPDNWSDFFKAQTDDASREWFVRVLRGPLVRGTQRAQYPVPDEKTLDGYGLALRAIAESGPELALSKRAIDQRVAALVRGTGPTTDNTTRALRHMSRIAGKRATEAAPSEEQLDAIEGEEVEHLSDVQPVLEYMNADDPANARLHIADPFFAFFLRWSASDYLYNSPPTPGEGVTRG